MPMKNTLRAKLIALSTVLGLGMSLAFAGTAFAAALEYNADTPVTFTDSTINFVIQSGSSATTVVVNATTVVVTVPLSDTFTVISSNRTLATAGESVDSVTTATCNGSNAQTLVIAAPAGGAEVITITPGSSACSSGSGGGGGGGGGATPPPPAPVTLPSASASGHPNGTLIIDNGTVYLIKDGSRYGFRNSAEYTSHGYNFAQVVQASSGDLALPLASSVVKALEGTLVLDSSDGITVYMIGTGGTKRGFASAAVFTALGYNFANLPSINLSDYPAGDAVNSSQLAHPDGALVLSNGTVWWVRGSLRLGFESEAVFNTYGFSWSKIVTANSADLALSEGSLVKFRDGTLVYDGGNYYLVSGGQKLMFTSTSDMSLRGYQASNAITASLSAYASGGNVQ